MPTKRMKTARATTTPEPVAAVEVDIQRATALRGLPGNAAIRRWVECAVAGRRARASLTVRIVDTEEGAALNERWRGRAGPTNVLSFPVSGLEAVAPALLGDIVLCAPVLKAEAAAQGKTLTAHCAHLVVHGTLHLLGYDHERPRAAAAMERLETALLTELDFPDPYAEPP